MMRPNSALATLRSLLEQQKQALLSGDLAALALLPDRLERAMRQLADDRPMPEAMTDLAQAAALNARLVLSAHEGLARARRAITPPGTLTTYDAQGRTQASNPDGNLIARR